MFMKAFLKISVLSIAISLSVSWVQAQGHPKVIIANGGVFGPANTATVADWDLVTGQYSVFDSIPASSVQHVSIVGRRAYVCADSFVVSYNLDTRQRVATALVPGARQSAATANGSILIAKGYGAVGDYVEERDINDLSFIRSFSGIGGECEGIVVHNDTAYVAVPLGFLASTGKIAVLSLADHTLHHEIDLDSNGRIIKNMYLQGETLYTVNQVTYGSSYGIISSYDIGSGNLQHHRVDLGTSQGAGIFQDKLYASFGGGVGAWSLGSSSLVDTNIVPGYWAATAMDTIAQRIYVTESDFATYGRIFAYDMTGQVVDSTDIGISAEAIAIDYNTVTAATPAANRPAALHSYPQPFGSELHIDVRELQAADAKLTVMDIAGHVVHRQDIMGKAVVDLETTAFASGMYLVQVSAKGKVWTQKVAKTGL
jgi:Secretion system C-terminal sorting domain